mmetsp:Transcript_40327/g.108200  ORF Transcript_40327/g.108200 Transcript_40327/m.108200 type:complete len:130 (+) Transcript_40327:555-944(+)
MIPLRWMTESSSTCANSFTEDFDPRHPVTRAAAATRSYPSPSPAHQPLAPAPSWSSHRAAESEEDQLCAICMERPCDVRLRPCGHDQFCRNCIMETVCLWSSTRPPCCPLCRAPFGTMVFSELAAVEQG